MIDVPSRAARLAIAAVVVAGCSSSKPIAATPTASQTVPTTVAATTASPPSTTPTSALPTTAAVPTTSAEPTTTVPSPGSVAEAEISASVADAKVHTTVVEGGRVAVLYGRPDTSTKSGTFEGLNLYRVKDGKVTETINLASTSNGAEAGKVPATTDRSPAKLSPSEADANRKVVTSFYTDVFGGADPTAIDRIVAENYIQHNPGVPTGRAGLKGLVQAMGGGLAGLNAGDVFAEGDFVVHINTLPGGQGAYLVDLFRVEAGQLAEHWDFMTPTP